MYFADEIDAGISWLRLHQHRCSRDFSTDNTPITPEEDNGTDGIDNPNDNELYPIDRGPSRDVLVATEARAYDAIGWACSPCQGLAWLPLVTFCGCFVRCQALRKSCQGTWLLSVSEARSSLFRDP
ncbi:hypothetical protein Y1Q_0021001 [Alligator mississippiensis]|uniref:Uncharacterized protein n=1 Tax=Alligator mississippiensis TaxID=8496 RepID=A0A151MTP0_ALLMI|nr:hypothetical protein Y1Q_0021001 [Alligator mississippiensis]